MRDRYFEIGSEPTFYSGLDDLKGKTLSEMIAWFVGRFDKVIIRPLEEVRELGKTNEAIWDLNLGVVTLVCSAIEALSTFYSPPNKRDRDKFILFVENFMSPEFQKISVPNNKTYAEILYEDYRCGLSHGLSIEGHEVTTRPESFIEDTDGYVSIDLWSLFEDFKLAFARYLGVLRSDKESQVNFSNRFKKIFVEPYE